MKTNILIRMMVILMTWVGVTAYGNENEGNPSFGNATQTDYYYYKGNKIPLILNENKVVVSVSKEYFETSERIHSNVQILSTITDEAFDIYIISRSDFEKLTSLDSWEEDSKAVLLTSGYITEEAKEVYSTPYLNVELKKEQDIDVLTSYAEAYGLKIVSQASSLLPLWYIVAITPECKMGSVECANKLWESGKFAASAPDFAFVSIEKPSVTSNIPFVQDGKRWNYIGFYSGVAPQYEQSWEYSYYLQGDTLICGIPCLRLYYDGGKNKVSNLYYGAMHEENGKVFFFPQGKDVPSLLYDFSCQVGDQPEFYTIYGDMKAVVTETQTVSYQSKDYRVLFLHDLTIQDDPAGGVNECWIEGVGSIHDLFATILAPGDGRKFLSCELNGETIFDYQDFLNKENGVINPFVEEGKVWHMLYSNPEASDLYPDYEFSYFIKGDTIITGMSCKKLYAYNEENKKKTEYKMALFEQEGKVFFIPEGSADSHVLYDFNFSAGSTTLVKDAIHPEWEIKMRNNEERYMETDGVRRKCLLVNRVDNSDNAEDYPSGWWIEGIGSELGPLNTWLFESAGNTNNFLYCEINGQRVALDWSVIEEKENSDTIKQLEEYANDYRPFIEEGKVWKVGHFDAGSPLCYAISYYYFDGDTIVGGMPCKRMMCRTKVNEILGYDGFITNSTEYVGALREEGRRVYLALPHEENFNLLYDFESEVGTTIEAYSNGQPEDASSNPCVISNKTYGQFTNDDGSTSYKGAYVEIYAQHPDANTAALTRWMEGVGMDVSPVFGHYMPGCCEYLWGLMTCTVGDEVLYRNTSLVELSDWEGAETTSEATKAKKRVDFTHVVKKKPKAPQRRVAENDHVSISGEFSKTELTIDLGALEDTYAVTITDASGQAVYAKDVKTNRVLGLNINISTFTGDDYTITLENEDEIFTGYFSFSDLRKIELTDEEKQLVKNNNAFAYRLFEKARGDESTIMSPLSITYALGMLNNGAAGQTQQEICEVLGAGDMGTGVINDFCRKLLTEAPMLDPETTAEIANTIYVNKALDYELQEGFVEKANEYYDAQPQALDFYDDATIDIINQWANDHTHGMIPTVFEDKKLFNKNAVSYLLNALYFRGVWSNPFDKSLTTDELFNGIETLPMMNQYEEILYTGNDLYQAVRLFYGNGSYMMTIYLPREGKTIGDVLSEKMNPESSYKDIYHDAMVNLKMPRFKTETKLQLKEIMIELGMPTAFDINNAEFPFFGNRDVFISDMFQKAAIELDEEGTKAAAVTVIEIVESVTSMPEEVTFHANRPFFYTISEKSTDAIFFIGQYLGENPAVSIAAPDSPATQGNNVYYDLTGRRITTPTKGIYIRNGKKVFYFHK